MRRFLGLLVPLAALATLAFPPGAAAVHNADKHSANTQLLFNSPNGRTVPAFQVNSDIAFWGNRAYFGDYGGVRIFDISNPAAPQLLGNFSCPGPQNDPVVWANRLLFLAVDRTMANSQCGAATTQLHGDRTGWEGVRIIDVSNPAAPTQVGAVYSDCGAHTITLHPAGAVLHLYVSSYPLRPGPTCGPVNGPAAGRDPVHGVIQVIEVPVNNPAGAREIAEPTVVYPGDPDNVFTPAEHDLPPADPSPFGPQIGNPLRACHDMTVYTSLNLIAAACAEQGQLWRIGPGGIPDTQNPVWVVDDNVDTDGAGGGDVAVDFWHSATFSWDGKLVNFIDESFGSGCPTVTPIGIGAAARPSDTGRTFFVRRATGAMLSQFVIPRPEEPPFEQPNYCSAHLGNVATAIGRYLLANAWYTGGIDVIDFTNPASPFEAAFYDLATTATSPGGDNWSNYHYENTPGDDNNLWMFATHGVEDPAAGQGAQVYRTAMRIDDIGLKRLNPQTQEQLLTCRITATPRALRAGQRSTLVVTVRAVPGVQVLPGQTIGGVPVRVRGPGVSVNTRTNGRGIARIAGLSVARRGVLRVSVPSVPNLLGCRRTVSVAAAAAGGRLTGSR
jgi:hypothetical protein